MSNSYTEKEPSDNTVLVSALGWLGVFLLFLLIVGVAYLPNRAVSQEERNVAERMTIRNTVRGEQALLVGEYQWVNQAEGVVRIPVEKAMELVVEEIRAEQAGNPGLSN
jgi:nicotinamide mononucleotide adenylyltransferase